MGIGGANVIRRKKEFQIKITRYSIFELSIIVLALLTTLEGVVTYWFNVSVSYADDILTVLVIFYTLFVMLFFHKKSKFSIGLFFFPIMMTVIGLIGNAINNYQNNTFAIVVDALAWQKFFLLYACFVVIFQHNENRLPLYLQTSQKIAKFLIIYALFTAVLNLLGIIQLAPGHGRYGFPAFSFGGHPSNSASILAAIVGLLYWNEKDNTWYIYACLILLVLTFRFKGIAFACLVIYFVIKGKFDNIVKSKKRFPLIMQMIPIVIGILCLCWEQIEFYFMNSTASRARALLTSFNIAAKSFPFGGGFASFGTTMAGAYYSDAYRQFGLSNVWGFMRDNYSFSGDGGFATIIGQLGWSGLLVIALNFNLIYKFIKKKSNKKDLPTSCVLLLMYLLISQSNEGAFYAENAPIFASVLALLTVGYNQLKEAAQ